MGDIDDPHSYTVLPLTTTEDEYNRLTGGGMNPRTEHYYYKRGNSAIIDSLPDDLLLEILVRVSAEDIHENARFVCRKWKRIIHGDGFVYSHFHRTCSGLLLAKFSESGSSPAFVAAAESGIQLSELRCKFNFRVLAGCNGLILGMESTEMCTKRFIVNPATKHRFDIPELLGLGEGLGLFGLAYAAATMEYKVVVTWCDFTSDGLIKCSILTLGVDKTWRQVPIEQLRFKLLPFQTPKITEGYIHWARPHDVLSMNVETEVITETPTPILRQDYQGKKCNYHYLSAGKYLSLLISCGDDFLWEIWEMKPETREWRKLVNKIDLRSHKCKIRQLSCEFMFPVAWVKYPDVLAFFGNIGMDVSCFFYDLDTDEINPFQSSDPDGYHSIVAHRNSLVWFR